MESGIDRAGSESCVQQHRQHDAKSGTAVEHRALGQNLSDAVSHSSLPAA
jgi:hypothetical protein